MSCLLHEDAAGAAGSKIAVNKLGRSWECSAVLFDLDGVLIDSTSCVERHWREWAEKNGLDTKKILEISHGVRNIDTMRLIAPHLDVEKEARQFATNEAVDTDGVMAVQGASNIIKNLEGANWAIVTSCSTELAVARLRSAQLPMPPLMVTGDDVSSGKPDPEPYLLAAERLAVDPAGCTVVEDAPAGVKAGKRAGMRVLAIAFTYDANELSLSGADVVIDRLEELSLRRQVGRPGLLLQTR
jgi:sugar-phosphatase